MLLLLVHHCVLSSLQAHLLLIRELLSSCCQLLLQFVNLLSVLHEAAVNCMNATAAVAVHRVNLSSHQILLSSHQNSAVLRVP